MYILEQIQRYRLQTREGLSCSSVARQSASPGIGGRWYVIPLHSFFTVLMSIALSASAKVTLTQVFLSTFNQPTSRAKYVFPVPARAAVCAFEMRTEDGHVITGVAKEKEKAAREHATAIRQGRLTGLVEWATDDGTRQIIAHRLRTSG